MNSETRNCQNCKKDFVLTDQDFELLSKMKMPKPTFCNYCQMVERMSWRNERTLYRRPNNAPNNSENIISIYSPDSDIVVYDSKTWWGDSWDAYKYGRDYDFSRPFFEQFAELIRNVPFPALQNWNAVNSEYCNCTSDNKNCFMVFGGDFNEDSFYSMYNLHSRNLSDVYWVESSEFCYELIECEKCYKVLYSEFARSCTDSLFLFDCVNCSNCIGCVGLRNKSYCILNQQYTKEEYLKVFLSLALHSFSGRESFREKFELLKLNNPRRFAYLIKTENCTGDRITNSKDCTNCFDIIGSAENLKDCFISGWNAKDMLRTSQAGFGTELIYNSFGVFSNSQKVSCSVYCPSSIEILYSYNCPNSSNLFGCVGLKKGQYSILNKQYSKEEYEILIPKIIEHMNSMPFKDFKGCVYSYGDFFPGALSIFAYNESFAQDILPKTKEEIEDTGLYFYDRQSADYTSTINFSDLPDTVPVDVGGWTEEVISCANNKKFVHCTGAFKFIKEEIEFYQRMNIPLPRYCFNCRHYARFSHVNSFHLYKTECQCGGNFSVNGKYKNMTRHDHGDKICSNEIQTSYSPDRPEIVYCEKCYQQEIN